MDAREATSAVCAAWERGDANAVAELFAENGRYEDPLWADPVIGPDAIRAQRRLREWIGDCPLDVRPVGGRPGLHRFAVRTEAGEIVIE
jgi:hypothetical protein